MLNTADETGRVEIMSANWCSSLKYHELNPSGACTHSCIHRINTDATPTPRQALFQAQRCISKQRDTRSLPVRKSQNMQWGWKDTKGHRSISHSPGTRNLEEGYQCNLNTERGINISHPTFRTHCEDMQVSHPLFTDSRTDTRDA